MFKNRRKTDLLLTAIESRSINKKVVKSHGFTGYTGNNPVFLAPGICISKDGVARNYHCKLPSIYKSYNLSKPAASKKLKRKVLKKVLRIFGLSLKNPTHGAVLLAWVMAGALSLIERPKCTIVVVGKSGTRKSSLAALGLNFAGTEFQTDNLVGNFFSTENSLEQMLLTLGGIPVVIDDFNPDENINISKKIEVLDRLVRAIGNGTFRLRKNEMDNSDIRPPSAALLITAEVVPKLDDSANARIFYSDIYPDDIDLKLLTELQKDAKDGVFMSVYATCIVYIISNRDEVAKNFFADKESAAKYLRDRYAVPKYRVAENFSSMMAAIKFILRLSVKYEAIPMDEAKTLYRDCIKAVALTTSRQNEIITTVNHLNGISNAFEMALLDGVCHFKDFHDGSVISLVNHSSGNIKDCSDSGFAGWLDRSTGDAYVDRDFDVAAITPYLSSSLSSLAQKGGSAFWRGIKQMGLLITTDPGRGRNSIRKTIRGEKRVVYHTRINLRNK